MPPCSSARNCSI